MKWWGGRVSNIVGHGCSGSREDLVIVLPPPLHLFRCVSGSSTHEIGNRDSEADTKDTRSDTLEVVEIHSKRYSPRNRHVVIAYAVTCTTRYIQNPPLLLVERFGSVETLRC